MHSEMEMIRCSIMRGGTSKGVFLLETDLPKDKELRDKMILQIYGSPDLRQIDGLGGADSLTSKVAIIGPSTREDADVDYTFGQVSITDAFVDYGGNCGNISSAVGPFAIDHGMVAPVEPVTKVRIHMTNTGRILTAEVPVYKGKAKVEGDFSIDGVPGTGAKIVMDWSDSVGGITGSLLPTGKAKDVIEAGGAKYTVSIVDAGNTVVFINAADLGITGVETPVQIDENGPLMERIEEIRGKACQMIGLVKDWREAKKVTPYQPFFAMVSKPSDHKCFNGVQIGAEDVDVVSRLTFMLKMHKAYPITGTVATGAAARIEGSVVWDLLSREARESDVLRIGHPSGMLPIEAVAESKDGQADIKKLGTLRTARKILDGYVYVRKSAIK
ncbi:MAG: 3-methylitaconate isomerase [Clostridium sp.]|nr:3-methylitaconate isomerase [Clostridium sp.]